MLGNTVVKGILNVIDVPRRVVTSGVKELGDVVAGGASFEDFINQAQDTEFGVGQFLGKTGNKWLDRGIGFIGDVALDPTTYILPGASELAGLGGRAALAGRGALKGLPEEVVQKLGRYGESAISAAEREAGGAFEELGQRGLRFGTPKHNVVIPGTGGLAQSVQSGLAAAVDAAGGYGSRWGGAFVAHR